jgi:hypothetical protein
MARLDFAPMPVGGVVRAGYSHEGTRMRFVTEVTGTSENHALQYLMLPPVIEKSERRQFYRLPTAFEPIDLFQLVRVPGSEGPRDLARISTVVDISEGGLCLSTRAPLRCGDRLAIHVELPGFGPIIGRMTVVGVQAPEKGFLNERAHCSFDDLDRRSRDRIARFVMQRQIDLNATVAR